MTPETPDDITERLRWESRLSRNGGVLFLPVLLDKAADEIEALRAQVAQYRDDAERWEWAIKHAEWRRSEHAAYISIPVDREADLSCTATRIAAIDKARKAPAADQSSPGG